MSSPTPWKVLHNNRTVATFAYPHDLARALATMTFQHRWLARDLRVVHLGRVAFRGTTQDELLTMALHPDDAVADMHTRLRAAETRRLAQRERAIMRATLVREIVK